MAQDPTPWKSSPFSPQYSETIGYLKRDRLTRLDLREDSMGEQA